MTRFCFFDPTQLIWPDNTKKEVGFCLKQLDRRATVIDFGVKSINK
jgi:hypothetical protein